MSSLYSSMESNTLCFPTVYLPETHPVFINRWRTCYSLWKLLHWLIILVVKNFCIIFNLKLFGFGLQPELLVMFLSATLNGSVGFKTSSLSFCIQIILTLNISYKLKKLRKVYPYKTFCISTAIFRSDKVSSKQSICGNRWVSMDLFYSVTG